MSASKDRTTRPSSRPTPPRPQHVFTREYLVWLAEQDEPITAAAADLAGPWHIEPDPKGGWAVLRQGESFRKSTRTLPTATFDRKETAQLASSILPGLARQRFRLASDPDDRGYPILFDNQPVGHSEFFHEDFVAALNVVEALMVAPATSPGSSPTWAASRWSTSTRSRWSGWRRRKRKADGG